ncbi:SufB/SufD family protein [Pectinatus haikarae]|uniref:SufB/SufD family protein n=1 Tax=Pectinatus haikarae TaxID=349096 RepID=UPI0018C821A1|nr:SufD family Fe-S cluster assembly protein [Pectinatus haikarae]
MYTALNANKLPVLTWNRFNVNSKELHLSNEPDSAVTPKIITDNDAIKINDNRTLDDIVFSGSDKKTEAYILKNASVTKSIIVPQNSTLAAPLIFDLTLQPTDKLTGIFDISLEENSSANIMISVSSLAQSTAQYADLIRVHAANGASLKLTCLQLLGSSAVSFNNIVSRLENDAKISILQIPLGAGTALASATADLRGYHSSASIRSDYIGHLEQDIDLNYVVRHYGKKTLSDIKMTGLLSDASRKTARGTIDFHRGCKGSSGNESENVLLLSEKARNKSVPLILCDEDDVAGTHGAAIGTLDEDRFFYLKSRGIDEKAARQLFLDSAVSRLKNLLPEILAAKIDNYSKEVLFNESV